MREECLLPYETVFIRKAFVGTTLSVRGKYDTLCVVLGEHRIGRQKKVSVSPLQGEEKQPWTVCSFTACLLLHRIHRLLSRLL